MLNRSLALPDSITGLANAAPPPAIVCSWTNGGLDAAWVHVAGKLDIATTGSCDHVETGNVDPIEPPVQALQQLVEEGVAS